MFEGECEKLACSFFKDDDQAGSGAPVVLDKAKWTRELASRGCESGIGRSEEKAWQREQVGW